METFKRMIGPYCSISDIEFSSVLVYKLITKARKSFCILKKKSSGQSISKTHTVPKWGQKQNAVKDMALNVNVVLYSQNISTDLKGPNLKYNLHYG